MKKVTSKPIRQLGFLAACLLFVALPRNGQTKAGDLDTSFGSDGTGIAKTSLQSVKKQFNPSNLITTTSGAIVVGGSVNNHPEAAGGKAPFQSFFGLLWYTANGLLDNSFGTEGLVSTNFGEGDDRLVALAAQPDGKIIAAGSVNVLETFENGDVKLLGSNFGIARHNSDGSLDPGFGQGGLVVSDFGTFDTLTALTVQPDGKIVVAGTQKDKSGISNLQTLVRYTDNGATDPTFGVDGNGIVIVNVGNFPPKEGMPPVPLPANVHNLKIQPDGKIIVSGTVFDASSKKYRGYVVRLLKEGGFDPSFGNEGLVLLPGFPVDETALALRNNGKLVMATGEHKDNEKKIKGYDTKLILYTLNSDGVLDQSFGQGGMIESSLQEQDHLSLSLQSDGKIVVSSIYDLLRFQDNGTPDEGFGLAGKVKLWDEELDQGYGKDNYLFQSEAHLLRPNGHILLIGNGHYIDPQNGQCFGFSKKPGTQPPNLVCEKIVTSGLIMKQYWDKECNTGKTLYFDADSDSYGDPKKSITSCTPIPHYVLNKKDCNDFAPNVNPKAVEICNNGIDDNCNHLVDERGRCRVPPSTTPKPSENVKL